ncbi:MULTISPECIES: RDD family protein [unclassified Alteromonas]|uniref:RDD family protein n=1 Tax=unclassified Alteromonas TaxID=2614992 RepID=UPI00068E5AD4|nr:MULTISPECIES: RDD family protein [unclassified Alteromonas]
MNTIDMERLEATQEYAGFGVRLLATIIDTLILLLVTTPLLYAIYGGYYWESDEVILGFADFLISFVLPFVGTVAFWVHKSATPGKMSLKLIVVDAKTGDKPTVQQSIIRYIGYIISTLPLLLGYLWVIWDPKKQALHDKLAGTVVLRPKNKGVDDVAFSGENA